MSIIEIEIEGLGTMGHLNNFQLVRIKYIANQQDRNIACIAFGLGMTVRQFKALPTELQQTARGAHHRLYTPEAMWGHVRTVLRLSATPRPYERVTHHKATWLGAELLRVKAELPYGHFRAWIDEKSGISYSQAQR